ncbi:MAG: SpoIID/LytB domain-containing protein [Bacillota bacterium]
MKRYIYIFLWCIVISLIFAVSSYSNDVLTAGDELRVALNTGQSFVELEINQGNYQLIDYQTQSNMGEAPAGTTWRISPVGKGSLQLILNGQPLPKLAGPLVILRPHDISQLNIFKFQGKRYRDSVLIENKDGKLNVINLISVERYLYGVLGAEMGANAPDEALKAQAVVSRTYALYYKEHPQLSYDVGTDTTWQVYGGYDMELLSGERVKNAVDSTRGQVIYYDGKIIQAFFHANSGGYTENSENVWWAYIPYIRAVAAPEDTYALHYPVQEGGWPANTYQWTKTFNKEELQRQLLAYSKDYPDNALNVGEITDIKYSHFSINPFSSPRQYMNVNTSSLRVTELEIIGTKGNKTFFRDGIRRVFDLRSSKFNLYFDSTVKIISSIGQNIVNSTQDIYALGLNGIQRVSGSDSEYYVQDIDGLKTIPKEFKSIIFNGNGYGHGLGMSQWGARGLAAQGKNYLQIISHYYNNNNSDGKLSVQLYTGQIK